MSVVTTSLDAPSPVIGRLPGRHASRVVEALVVANRAGLRVALISAVALPMVYLAALGFGIGSFIDDANGHFGGLGYVVYVAPGILMAAVLQIVANEATYPVLNAVFGTREYHAMVATPLGADDVVIGHLTYILIRVAVCATAFVGLSALLGAFVSPWAAGAVLIAVLCGWAHAAPLVAIAATKSSDEWVLMIQRFYVVPAFLFAGTFFPVSQLPAVLQPVAWFTPMWHATTAARDLQLGTPPLLDTLVHVGYLTLWGVVGTAFAVSRLRRRVLA